MTATGRMRRRKRSRSKSRILVHQRLLVDGVRDRMEGKVVDPEPKTPLQAEAQIQAAEERKDAAHAAGRQSRRESYEPGDHSRRDAREGSRKVR